MKAVFVTKIISAMEADHCSEIILFRTGMLWRIIIYHEQNIGLFYRNHRHYDHILSK
jgi:hypothetical protein